MTPGRSVWLRRWTARETDREAYRGGAVCGLSARRFSHSPPGVGVFLFPTRAAGCMQTCRRFVLHRHNSPTGPVHTLDTCPDTCIPTRPCTCLSTSVYPLCVWGCCPFSRACMDVDRRREASAFASSLLLRRLFPGFFLSRRRSLQPHSSFLLSSLCFFKMRPSFSSADEHSSLTKDANTTRTTQTPLQMYIRLQGSTWVRIYEETDTSASLSLHV